MTTLFEDDFESGALLKPEGKWDTETVEGANIAEIISTDRYEGTYAAHFYVGGGADNGSFIRVDVPRRLGQANKRVYVKILQKGADPANFMSIQMAPSERVRIGVIGTGRFLYLFWYSATDGAFHTLTSSISLELNRWYCIELQIETGIDSTIKVFLDDVDVTDSFGDTTSNFTQELTAVSLGGNIGAEYRAGTDVMEIIADAYVYADAYIGPLGIPPPKWNITVNSSPVTGVIVNLDGVYVGTTPTAPIPVDPGSHTVEVEETVER